MQAVTANYETAISGAPMATEHLTAILHETAFQPRTFTPDDQGKPKAAMSREPISQMLFKLHTKAVQTAYKIDEKRARAVVNCLGVKR